MALMKCKECGNQVSDKAATCPNCGTPINVQEVVLEASPAGKPTKEETTNQAGVVVVLLVGLIVVTVYVLSNWEENVQEAYEDSQSKSPSTAKFKPQFRKKASLEVVDLEVVNYEWKTGDYGIRYIVGTIKNNSNKQFGYAQVQINLYDDSDAQVGSTFTNINNLEPNSIWKFEAVVMEDSATKARVKGVNGY